MRTSRWVAGIVAVAAVLAGCSSDPKSADEPKKSDSVAVPKGFDLPAGVTLTPGGTRLAAGGSASVVYQVADRAASAITVTLTGVKKGSIKDFRFFSLDDQTRRSTPFYVSVTVKNEGPAGLGGATPPIFAHDSANTVYQANDIVGWFKPCPRAVLPKRFLPGSSAKLCLVYLMPKGKALVSVDLQTGSPQDAISWSP